MCPSWTLSQLAVSKFCDFFTPNRSSPPTWKNKINCLNTEWPPRGPSKAFVQGQNVAYFCLLGKPQDNVYGHLQSMLLNIRLLKAQSDKQELLKPYAVILASTKLTTNKGTISFLGKILKVILFYFYKAILIRKVLSFLLGLPELFYLEDLCLWQVMVWISWWFTY